MAIITHVGPLTFSFTFSAADMHWPELHSLFQTQPGIQNAAKRSENVITHPHIVDWYFTVLRNF